MLRAIKRKASNFSRDPAFKCILTWKEEKIKLKTNWDNMIEFELRTRVLKKLFSNRFYKRYSNYCTLHVTRIIIWIEGF